MRALMIGVLWRCLYCLVLGCEIARKLEAPNRSSTVLYNGRNDIPRESRMESYEQEKEEGSLTKRGVIWYRIWMNNKHIEGADMARKENREHQRKKDEEWQIQKISVKLTVSASNSICQAAGSCTLC